MRTPPTFYANMPDEMHCLAACVRMALAAQGLFISWEDLDRLLEAIPEKGSWTISAAAVLAARVPGTKFYSHIDYKQFAQEGEPYLARYWNSEYYRVMKKYSASEGFEREQRHARDFVDLGWFENRFIFDGDVAGLLRSHLLIGVLNIRRKFGDRRNVFSRMS